MTPSFNQITSGGYSYNLAAVGDVNADGRADIVLQRTASDGVTSSLEVYRNDGGAGPTWTKILDESFGAPWIRIELGNIDSLPGDEIVLMRNGTATNKDPRIVTRKLKSDGTWEQTLSYGRDILWLDMSVGNAMAQGNGAIDEIVVSRDTSQLNSLLYFQYANNNLSDAPNGQFMQFPAFQDLAQGDVNMSGDLESFMIRDPQSDSGTSLLGRNFGDDPFYAGWTSPGLALGARPQDGRDGRYGRRR